MQLKIDGTIHTFIPIQTFRTEWQLPQEFCLAYFEPKDWLGLGSIEGSGALLMEVKQQVLQVVPAAISLPQFMPVVDLLAETFENQLTAANAAIGLSMVEVDFAVAGFHDLIQAVAYRLVQLAHDPAQRTANFDFSAVYQSWLDDSVRISTTCHRYEHRGIHFDLYVVNNAYGRVGLEVHNAATCYYVLDSSLACPAANYMTELCRDVTNALRQALD